MILKWMQEDSIFPVLLQIYVLDLAASALFIHDLTIKLAIWSPGVSWFFIGNLVLYTFWPNLHKLNPREY